MQLSEESYLLAAKKDFIVWTVLVLAAIVAWWLGHIPEQLEENWINPLIMLMAYIKMRLVMQYFMEFRKTSLLLRLLFEGWCLAVPVVLLALLGL